MIAPLFVWNHPDHHLGKLVGGNLTMTHPLLGALLQYFVARKVFVSGGRMLRLSCGGMTCWGRLKRCRDTVEKSQTYETSVTLPAICGCRFRQLKGLGIGWSQAKIWCDECWWTCCWVLPEKKGRMLVKGPLMLQNMEIPDESSFDSLYLIVDTCFRTQLSSFKATHFPLNSASSFHSSPLSPILRSFFFKIAIKAWLCKSSHPSWRVRLQSESGVTLKKG